MGSDTIETCEVIRSGRTPLTLERLARPQDWLHVVTVAQPRALPRAAVRYVFWRTEAPVAALQGDGLDASMGLAWNRTR